VLACERTPVDTEIEWKYEEGKAFLIEFRKKKRRSFAEG